MSKKTRYHPTPIPPASTSKVMVFPVRVFTSGFIGSSQASQVMLKKMERVVTWKVIVVKQRSTRTVVN